MAVVKFTMTWKCRGESELEVPDDIIEEGEDAIREYLEDNWVSVMIPFDGTYVTDSDEFGMILDY